jgi:hypothetical protein
LRKTPIRLEAPDSSTASGASAVEAVEVDVRSLLAPAQAPDELGRLGPYRVLKVLGTGGMGIVFLAEDTVLQRTVALKTLRPGLAADVTFRRRFLREAQAAAKVEDDHIVPIFGVGEEGAVPYLAMPVLKGQSLEARLKETAALEPAEVVRLGALLLFDPENAHFVTFWVISFHASNGWALPKNPIFRASSWATATSAQKPFYDTEDEGGGSTTRHSLIDAAAPENAGKDRGERVLL